METPVRYFSLPRVLAVEDDAAGAFLMRCSLEQFGCPHDVVRTGNEALRMLGEKHYDIILLDIKMPDINGYEVVRLIREDEKQNGKPRKRIIAVTGFALAEDRALCLRSGMDDYISKPFGIQALGQKLGLELPAS